MPYEAIADFKLNEPAEQERDAYLKPTPPAEPFQPRVGRNRPCPCGSGRKYKKCHLPADEAEHDATRSLAATLPPLRDTRIGWIPARAGGTKGGSTTSWTLSVDRFLRALVGR